MLLLLLVIPFAIAVDVSRHKVNLTSTSYRVTVEWYNKTYYKSLAVVSSFQKRVRWYKLEFTSLKPWTNKFWFDLRFYHFRNNQFHAFPINLGCSIDDLFEKDYYGIGSDFQKYMGRNLPYPPKNYSVHLDLVPNAKIFEAPMLGDYKIEVALKDGNVGTFLIVVFVDAIEDIKPKCRKCAKH